MLIAGLLFATAIISMWVSNTAAAIMMLPIAIGVVDFVSEQASEANQRAARNFGIASMLAVAYGASIGGCATIIGTPPNGVLAGFLRAQFDDPLTFWEWTKLGLPVTLVALPVAWALLVLLFPCRTLDSSGAKRLLTQRHHALGKMHRAEWCVVIVFTCAAFAWSFREPLCHALGLTRDRPAGGKPELLLTDAGIAIAAALALFLIPAGRGQPVLDWRTASKIPWGILLLFGGGLTLAAQLEAHKVDVYAASLFAGLKGLSPVLVIAVVAAAAMFISEIGSNTAVATVLLPVVASAAPTISVHPYVLCFAVTLAVSLAFMMPSGTPPNALVFTSGRLRVKHMIRAGFALNLACVVIITLACSIAASALGWKI
jgi:sodium-dependent dicarboxylate transporter 2/3/5